MYRIIPLALAVAGMLTLAAPTAQAGKKAGKNNRVAGTIKSVSNDGKQITVEVAAKKKKAATTREIKITENTKVKFAGKKKNADKTLKVGQSVRLKLDKANKDTAVKIKVGKAKKNKKKKTDQ
jgi:hypothetical protein